MQYDETCNLFNCLTVQLNDFFDWFHLFAVAGGPVPTWYSRHPERTELR